MKNVFKIYFFFVLLFFAFSTVRADQLDKFITEQIQKRKIPGLSLAVIKDGKVIKATGYGLANLELQVPATQNTVYEIGSISKQFASECSLIIKL